MIENVADEIMSLMKNHLAEAFDEQNAAYKDGHDLEPIQSKSILFGERNLPNDVPALLVLPQSMSQVSQVNRTKDVLYEIDLGAAVYDSDEQAGFRKLTRMLRAMENVLERECRNGSGPIVSYETTGIDYNASLFNVANEDGLLRTGVLSGQFRERLLSYTENQV